MSTPADIWAVVPVKELDGAKQRLAGLLSPAQRRALWLEGRPEEAHVIERASRPGQAAHGTGTISSGRAVVDLTVESAMVELISRTPGTIASVCRRNRS